MATLQLNLIKHWFDLTLQGIKKEEWGFTGCIPKFIIQHGEVLETFNIK